jgi:hypothetical protein
MPRKHQESRRFTEVEARAEMDVYDRAVSEFIRSILRITAIFMTCTTTKVRHSLEASLVFSAARMASFSVLEIEYMAHNDLREHRVRGEPKGYGRAY